MSHFSHTCYRNRPAWSCREQTGRPARYNFALAALKMCRWNAILLNTKHSFMCRVFSDWMFLMWLHWIKPLISYQFIVHFSEKCCWKHINNICQSKCVNMHVWEAQNLFINLYFWRVLINKPRICGELEQGRFLVSNLSGVRITNRVTSKHP